MNDRPILESGFNGLARAQPSLPASWYLDPDHHVREIARIWTRNWVYLCRSDSIAEARAYRTFEIAGQPVLIVRNEAGSLQGFFNTCRHRGSILCTASQGVLKKPLIVCPYHQWAYDLTGRLRATGPMRPVCGFDTGEHPLMPIGVAEWGGFVFANLDPNAAAFDALFGAETASVANWPLGALRVGHSYSKLLNCNWKIFWENYNECLHCPNIHPELCDLVPIYGRAIMARRDDPDWRSHASETSPHVSGGLREGAESWSMDGSAQGYLPGLTQDDVAAGHRYVTLLPSVFIAHHADYVRTVRITPLTVDTTELSVDWLFHPSMLSNPDFDLERITRFASLVIDQDGAASELNQAGLRASAFEHGVLMQEEYEVFLFQDWIRGQLGEPMRGQPAASRASRRVETPAAD